MVQFLQDRRIVIGMLLAARDRARFSYLQKLHEHLSQPLSCMSSITWQACWIQLQLRCFDALKCQADCFKVRLDTSDMMVRSASGSRALLSTKDTLAIHSEIEMFPKVCQHAAQILKVYLNALGNNTLDVTSPNLRPSLR